MRDLLNWWIRDEMGELIRPVEPYEVLEIIYRPCENRPFGVYAVMLDDAVRTNRGGDPLMGQILWLYAHLGGIGSPGPSRMRRYTSRHVNKQKIITLLDCELGKEKGKYSYERGLLRHGSMTYRYATDELTCDVADARFAVLAVTRLRLSPPDQQFPGGNFEEVL